MIYLSTICQLCYDICQPFYNIRQLCVRYCVSSSSNSGRPKSGEDALSVRELPPTLRQSLPLIVDDAVVLCPIYAYRIIQAAYQVLLLLLILIKSQAHMMNKRTPT